MTMCTLLFMFVRNNLQNRFRLLVNVNWVDKGLLCHFRIDTNKSGSIDCNELQQGLKNGEV